ncbi:hypothetical protein J40TS1_36930 [Paenibacillus montaniterrae]|uniref:Uncharacterized protein n=1 Tax=Paenibacillus montaniterrae TaxID=429341 RepID=A0A920CYN6_9BACL|nr:hypothetical protein [Paenibacillus montaniterrae]GIP18051.1 hypothetical protein J40TS1_36930 [Paenibacillus montaniterrae]
MKRTLVKALIFSVCLMIVYFGLKVAAGIVATDRYAPNILESYNSIDKLQQTVEFGSTLNNPVYMISEIIAVLLAGIAVYLLVAFLKAKLKQH